MTLNVTEKLLDIITRSHDGIGRFVRGDVEGCVMDVELRLTESVDVAEDPVFARINDVVWERGPTGW